MLDTFDFSVIIDNWRYLFATGMAFTLKLTCLAMLGGVMCGMVLSTMRLSGIKWLAFVAKQYVDLFRSLPLVLVIFWFYFLVPYLGAWVSRSNEPFQVGGFASALITFILFEAAYYSEIIRTGIQSVSNGQKKAAWALGMNSLQTMITVVLPQAYRNMFPVLLTQTIILFQDVSLVYVLSLPDFVGAATKIGQRDGRLVEMYLFVAAIYFILCSGLSFCVKQYQKRISIIK